MPPATKARHSARHTTGVIPALSRDRVRIARRWLAVLAPLALVACQHQSSYLPGTPEHGAAIVSRGYDCGLRVERGRVVASYRGAERQRRAAALHGWRTRFCRGRASQSRPPLKPEAGATLTWRWR
ncbi:MAG: hypothetical protein MUC44_13530 [Beijerinckiaceae bacterium]|nr:hypothetical protein [Beijerinckiaceae bacterium]